jgi:hypothetical protein
LDVVLQITYEQRRLSNDAVSGNTFGENDPEIRA